MGNREKTRQAIIEASIQLFYHKGFIETTFSDISGDIGISQPALYAHFKNKMDLLKNVSIYAAEVGRLNVKKEVNPNTSAESRLKSYLLANLKFFKNNKELAHAIIALYYFSSSSKEIFEVFIFVQEKTIDQIETFLIQGCYEKTFSIKDSRTVARLVHSLMVGDCYKIIFSPSEAAAKNILSTHWPAAQKLLIDTL